MITSAHIVAGMAFGDEGKGRVTDRLVREWNAQLVVRYNGGPQAAHNVITPDGLHHTFSQFGSGTLAGARTHLSKYMLIDPLALQAEAETLKEKGIHNPEALVSVDPECLIITPYQRLAGQDTERKRRESGKGHGSVGMGVGETRGDRIHGRPVLRVADVFDLSAPEILRAIKKEKQMDLMVAESPSLLVSLYREILERVQVIPTWRVLYEASGPVIFEGAQGVLLDETWGFPPYHTWTDCTYRNADRILDDASFGGPRERIGVVRSYFTRHGLGPFPSEDPDLKIPEAHNGYHTWMGTFRQGYFDNVLFRYALEVSKPHRIVMTHGDRCPQKMIQAYSCESLEASILRAGNKPTREMTAALMRAKPIVGEWDMSVFHDRPLEILLSDREQIPVPA